jgi:hypothetical protein
VLPLGDYSSDREISLRTPSGRVRRLGFPDNQYRLFAACAACDGPADVPLFLPAGLNAHAPFQAFVSWEDTRGLMIAFQGARCGTGRRSPEQLAADGAAGTLDPWVEACRRLSVLGREHDFWLTHADHRGPTAEGPAGRLFRP